MRTLKQRRKTPIEVVQTIRDGPRLGRGRCHQFGVENKVAGDLWWRLYITIGDELEPIHRVLDGEAVSLKMTKVNFL
jgi:hypothetical protein